MAGLFGSDSRTAATFRAGARGATSEGLGDQLKGVVAHQALPATLAYDALGRTARQTLGRLPGVDFPQVSEQSFEPYELPRAPKHPKVAERLQALYGPEGEHWEESLTEMRQTPEGRERFKLWAKTIKADSAYAPRYEELKKRLGNSPEAFWTQVLGEYKEERKKDAEIGGAAAGMRAAWDVATLAPGTLAYRAARSGGASPKLAMQTAVTNELLAPGEIVNAGVRGVGKAIAKRPRVLALPLGGAALGGAVTGDLEGVAQGALAGAGVATLSGAGQLAKYMRGGGQPFTGMLDKAAGKADDVLEWATRTEKALPDRVLTLDDLGWGKGKLRPNAMNLVEATGGAVSPNLGLSGSMVTGGLGAMYGGMEYGPLGALVGGLTAGATAKLAPKAPGAVLGGVGGALAGASLNEEDPFMGALMLGTAGAAGGFGAQKGLRHATNPHTLYAGGDIVHGDLKPMAAFIAHFVPEADLRRISRFAEQLYPALDEADRMFDASTARMRDEFVEAVGGVEVLNDVERMKRLTDLSRKLGRAVDDGGAPIGKEVIELSPLGNASAEDISKAYAMRRVIDGWFDDAVNAGLMKPEQYLAGYVPRVLDEAALWKALPETLQNRGDVRTLDAYMRTLFDSLDSRGAIQGYDSAVDLFIENPGEFLRRVDGGELGFSADDLKKILGGDMNYQRLRTVAEFAHEYKVRPSTLMKILRGGPKSGDAGIMVGGVIKNDWIPKELLDEFGLARTGADLPVIEHMPTVIEKYIMRTQRRRYYDPLVRAWNSVDEAGQLTEELSDPRLQALHEGLVKDKAVNLSKIARKLINSRLGVPSATDVLIEDAISTLPGMNPAKARAAARIVLDMQYSGALGFNAGAATRGLFQGLLGATAQGAKDYAYGMREVARRPEFYEQLAGKYGALRDPMQEAFDVARVIGDTPFKRGWNMYVESAFEMFHAADRRVRLWAFATGYRRAMLSQDEIAKVGASHEALSAMRPEQKERFASFARSLDKEEFAGRYGTAMSDLTNWIYGNRGSPLAARSMIGANAMIFKTWPANYLSLMYQWGADGQIQKILNMSLAAAILERAANEGGVGRLTGLTAPMEGPGSAIPAGPMPQGGSDLVPPLAQAVLGEMPATAGKVLRGVATNPLSPGEWGVRAYENNASLMPVRPAYRAYRSMTADDPEVALRTMFGATRPTGDR